MQNLFLGRGLDFDFNLPAFDGDDDATDSDTTASVSSVSSSSGSEKEAEDDPDSASPAVLTEAFVVNTGTLRFHAAIFQPSVGIRRACAPTVASDMDHWSVWHSDPLLLDTGYEPCSHAACATVLNKEDMDHPRVI